MRAQTEVEVVVDDLVGFLETAERLKDTASHQHAGAGHRDDIALCQRQAEIARLVRRGKAERVARDAARGKEHAGVLHLAAGIQKLRPHDRHLRPLRVLEQCVQPVGLGHLDIVVQEQQVLAGRGLHAAVVEMRPVECVRHRHDLVGVLLQPDLPRDLTVRDVVDADDLEVAIGGMLAQGIDAGLDVASRGAGRDDDRHHAGCRLRSPQTPCARYRTVQHLGRDAAPCRGARQCRDLHLRIIDLLHAALAQQARHMVHLHRLLRASQHDIEFASPQHIAQRDAAPAEQRSRGKPRSADIVRRQQQVGREIRFEERLTFAARRAEPHLVRVQHVRTSVQPAGQRELQQRVAAQSITRAQQTDQPQRHRLVSAADRLIECRVV